ncbi:MAG TPA: AMP-binding protein [Clostridiaceae bacterium]|nr:AMP-binding protein [Clostridiaceae bacterium]
MKKIGLLKSAVLIKRAEFMSRDRLQKVQEERLQELVTHAREKSPYYRDLYRDLGEHPSLETLPVTRKQTLMKNFDTWVTDPELTLEKVKKFMEDEDNVGRYMDGKYKALHTSGSTGVPCIVIHDKAISNFEFAMNLARTFSHMGENMKVMLKGGKYCSIFYPGFFLGHSEMRRQLLASPLNRLRVRSISVMEPTAKIVELLNKFKPVIIAAYPTVMELLLQEIEAGRLKIRPTVVVLGGERVKGQLKKALMDSWNCRIINSYGATESGMITFECKHGRNHVNEDWVIVEPVDENYERVPSGVQSNTILVTNLMNFIQPYIRYEITDRIRMFDEPCPCGSPFPYLVVEGRTDEVLAFEGDHGVVRCGPMSITEGLYLEGILRFQLIQQDVHNLLVRILCEEGADREALFAESRRLMLAYLADNDVHNVEIRLDEKLPHANPKSGKFQNVFKEKKETMPTHGAMAQSPD